MVEWVDTVADINELLLDRQIFDSDGRPVGKVDDLEFTDPGDGGAPVLTAILCGPMAFGPRLGGPIGTWWLSVGRRLRPNDDPYPVRIAFEDVAKVDRKELTLRVAGDDLGTIRLRDWTRNKVVSRIPGGNVAGGKSS